MAWHLGLYDLLTTCAGQTWAGGLVHNVVARHILQFFQDIGPQFFEAAAAVGASVTGCDRLRDAVETRGEWLGGCAVSHAKAIYRSHYEVLSENYPRAMAQLPKSSH